MLAETQLTGPGAHGHHLLKHKKRNNEYRWSLARMLLCDIQVEYVCLGVGPVFRE